MRREKYVFLGSSQVRLYFAKHLNSANISQSHNLSRVRGQPAWSVYGMAYTHTGGSDVRYATIRCRPRPRHTPPYTTGTGTVCPDGATDGQAPPTPMEQGWRSERRAARGRLLHSWLALTRSISRLPMSAAICMWLLCASLSDMADVPTRRGRRRRARERRRGRTTCRRPSPATTCATRTGRGRRRHRCPAAARWRRRPRPRRRPARRRSRALRPSPPPSVGLALEMADPLARRDEPVATRAGCPAP